MDTRFKKGITSWNKGKTASEELKKRISIATKKAMEVAKYKLMKPKLSKICPKCGITFQVKPSLDRVKCCSRSCARKGVPSPMKGKKASEETRKKQSLAKIGIRGEDHWNWKGGEKNRELKKRMRQWSEWKEWRSSVFTRDSYSCRECGSKNCYLEPHHIIPLRETLSRAFDKNNGITLCRPCHKKTMWREEDFANKYFALLTKV